MARPRTRTPDKAVLKQLGVTEEQIAGMTEKELLYLEQCIREVAETGTSATAASLIAEDYKWEPVSMERFLADPFYMGKIATEFYPAVKALLIECFDVKPYPNTILLGGAIGWGKSASAQAIVTYVTYRLTCLRDPHAYYGLARGGNIYGAVYSLNLDQALDGIYGKVLRWIDEIPYFVQKCSRLKRQNSSIKFSGSPIEVIPASRMEHTIGKDLFFGVIDEANFMNPHGGAGGTEVAEGIYNSVIRRIESRFHNSSGESPGYMVIASSRTSKASFFEQKTKELAPKIAEGKAKLYAYSQWEVKPASYFKKPRFPVEVGDRLYPSRILRDGEDPRPGAQVIMVPGDFRAQFEADVEKSLRDLAGIATESMTPLFHDKQVIRRCATAEHQHPFTKPMVTLDIRNDVGLDAYFRTETVFRVHRSHYELRLNPQCARYVHVDIGLTQDALGLAMVHVAGYKTVRRSRKDGTFYEDRAPVIVADFVLRIVPPKGSEIDLSKVRAFLQSLKDWGVPIWRVSYDSYNSRGEIQTLKKLGFDALVYSVDRDDEAYLALRQAITEERMIYYPYEPLFIELSELERDLDERKVDHPQRSPTTGDRGSKDVSDALAAAAWQAMLDKRVIVPATAGVSPAKTGVRVDRGFEVTGGAHLWSDLDKEVRR